MAVTQADIDALNRAISDGVRQVTIGETTTTFNTTDSLIRARDDMQRQLNAQKEREAGRKRPKRSLLYYAGRGYQ